MLTMNILRVAVLFVILISRSVMCQSTYVFQNWNPNVGLDAPVFDADGNRLFGSNYVAMLYGGPTADFLVPAVSPVYEAVPPMPFTFGLGGAGYFRLMGVEYGYVQIPIGPCGGLEWLQVRAWDLRVAPTYEQAVSLGMGGYGASSLFQLQGGAPCAVNGDIPRYLVGLQSFSLQPVPEPGTVLLLLLGVPLLCLARRRRRC